MAKLTPTTSDIAASIGSGAASPIATLFALRTGLLALLDQLEAMNTQADEDAFNNALDELWRLDTEILGLPPHGLEDLRRQAAVVRRYAADTGGSDALLGSLLGHIEGMAA